MCSTRTPSSVGARKISLTEMYFSTGEPGSAVQRIHIKNGKAQVVATKDGVEVWRRDVCAAAAKCATLFVDSAGEATRLMEAATKALVDGRHLAQGETPGDVCEVCVRRGPYSECAAGDKVNVTLMSDAKPACFAHVVSEIGFAEALGAELEPASPGARPAR